MTIAAEPSRHDFQGYEAQVYAWAFRILGRHHDALDVVQDVFLRWAQQCQAGHPTQPRGWLRRVTINRAIDLRRRTRRTSSLALHAEEVAAASPSGDGPADLDEGLLRERLLRAMDKLSEMQRLVLIAKTFDELTFAEIARDVQSSVSTVKTHYVRALRAVRGGLDLPIENEVRP